MMAETQIVRIQVISDLHTEAGPFAEPDPSDLATGADIVILAGDIARAPDAVAVAARMFPDVPLVSVSGNHENYDTGMTIDEGIDAMRRAALGHASAECRPVHVLEDEEAVVEVRGISLRFLGSCTWTDFALFGDPVRDRMIVERGLNDFRLIRGRSVNLLGLFLGRGATPFHTSEWLDRHDASREFLRSRLAVPHDGPTVVVTHHLPSMRSVAQQYRKSRLSAGFASRLDDLVGMGATLWVHGHTHSSHMWRAPGGTLVACNPAGYADLTHAGAVVRENARFDPRLVIDIRRGGPDGLWRAGREPARRARTQG
jgi:predicted phosphodiesterase